MPSLVIGGCGPWDGTYDFDDFAFTNRELYEIRKLSGVRAGELIEALEANDTAAYVGVGVVVLTRAGKQIDADDLWNAPVGSIRIELNGNGDGAADPPTIPDRPAEPLSGAGGSGGDSTSGGDHPAKTP